LYVGAHPVTYGGDSTDDYVCTRGFGTLHHVKDGCGCRIRFVVDVIGASQDHDRGRMISEHVLLKARIHHLTGIAADTGIDRGQRQCLQVRPIERDTVTHENDGLRLRGSGSASAGCQCQCNEREQLLHGILPEKSTAPAPNREMTTVT
jgi:hypothetical protein